MPIKMGVEYVILFPGDFDPLLPGLLSGQADSRLGNIGRRHIEASPSEVNCLSTWSGTEIERAPATQPELVQRLFEIFVQFRVEPWHGFDLSFLVQLLPVRE